MTKRFMGALFLALCLATALVHAQTVWGTRWRFSTGCEASSGSGSPEGAVTGTTCDVYLQNNGTASTILWIKESGVATTTGWKAVYTTGVVPPTTGAALANTKIWIGSAGGVAAEFPLSGDVSMTAGGVVTVADDSHDHTAASVSGLGAADFANVATSLVLMGPEVGDPTPAIPSFRALDLGDVTVARARYYRGSNQSIADSTWTDVAWDTLVWYEDFSATPTTSIVFPVAGGYEVTGAVAWDNNATGGRWIVVDYSDGSTQDCKLRAEPDATYDHPMAIPSCVINAAASATVKVSVWQDSGDALNVIGSSYSTIQIVRLW